MTKSKRRQRKLAVGDADGGARRPTVAAVVPSPYTPGTIDHVTRVLDTILLLRRTGRISLAEYEAAERYRDAYDAVRATGCAIDPTKSGRGSPVSRIPAPAALLAAETLTRATRALERHGSPVVVEMIVGQGYTIEEAAGSLFGRDGDGKPSRQSREAVGVFLRRSLAVLADLWAARRRA